MPDLPEVLAAHRGTGYVVAPAGFGKTHLIAASLCHAGKRQLVLTHTYAGVNALRRKLRLLRVPTSVYHVDTIASWALSLALSYPGTSGWMTVRPTDEGWCKLYEACVQLLDSAFVRRIVRASYGGLYVDEYQDCSHAQHEIILRLARDLPCRILGDPLQGIFDFDGEPIDWDRDVVDAFPCLGKLETPHRWERAGAPLLGAWLRDVRDALEDRSSIDLTAAGGRLIVALSADDTAQMLVTQVATCRRLRCAPQDKVIAIHGGHPTFKAKCHRLAKNLRGMYASLEEIEGRDLFTFIRRLQQVSSANARLKCIIRLASRTMSGLQDRLPAGTIRGERVSIRSNTRSPRIAAAANTYLLNPTSANIAALLLTIKDTPHVHVARGDLFDRTIGVLRKHAAMPGLTLAEAADKYHVQFRHRGRPVWRRRLIGTTLLVKGLEFDHAIVLDAASLSRKELYVALTRGAKTLRVVSSQPLLNPED